MFLLPQFFVPKKACTPLLKSCIHPCPCPFTSLDTYLDFLFFFSTLKFQPPFTVILSISLSFPPSIFLISPPSPFPYPYYMLSPVSFLSRFFYPFFLCFSLYFPSLTILFLLCTFILTILLLCLYLHLGSVYNQNI